MPTEERIWQLLDEVFDPEVPVLSILDLGIVRGVQVQGEQVTVTITPTYSGCPAMNTIATDIRLRLLAEGITQVTINNQLRPAWTTDWMTDAGREKLEAYGIAAPVNGTASGHVLNLFGQDTAVRCPLCKSEHTHLVSQFGSTACKASYQCDDCQEPFDYFKCH
ncbi:phenylacetate-CoA oxygenase subunit PaaJ [Hymenobacter taeanensis]|uniref:Phenylacetate-CoA oxygenase subunit PaaJ n=1 Tax=Hymenobacter taeanensis TaxID=2735321 RepID=A0A6M6BLX0_9BACT|nr:MULTISPECIES: 1,2-phenylacetyl-CoA epoxidase subunit PaaD [Hymenobacter]QJX48105.1 phenylacetate-CoA oxygenase subunit PaaJ [Hymenobacter taeanensis]UOQ82428.1 phenylacetate-CoA oxygenase subunit PaaJ [Hymenobacter sp. 5414T-23]